MKDKLSNDRREVDILREKISDLQAENKNL
jgi:polyhydroxyalkanoate synthesis regulator phasin